MRFRMFAGLTALFMALTATSWAHHSHAAYTDTFMDLQGMVKEIHLVVPHSWIYLEVKNDKGEPEIWAVEATGRTGLQKVGITIDTVKAGDPVKIRCHRLRDGSNGCLLGFLKAKDGTVKDWDGGNAPAPSDF